MPKTQTLVLPEPGEKEVQAMLMRRLNALGFLVVRINSASFRNSRNHVYRAYVIEGAPGKFRSAGLPDLFCVRDGEAFFVEVKTLTGALSENQRFFQQFAQKKGVTVYTVYGLRGASELLAAI